VSSLRSVGIEVVGPVSDSMRLSVSVVVEVEIEAE